MEKQEAKQMVAELMQAGYHWKEASRRAGIEIGRSTAYSWWKKYRKEGMGGLIDGRHGHTAKVREPVLQYIEEAHKENPCISSRELQNKLQDQMQVYLSISHLN